MYYSREEIYGCENCGTMMKFHRNKGIWKCPKCGFFKLRGFEEYDPKWKWNMCVDYPDEFDFDILFPDK